MTSLTQNDQFSTIFDQLVSWKLVQKWSTLVKKLVENIMSKIGWKWSTLIDFGCYKIVGQK
jgi:hypothetical protein